LGRSDPVNKKVPEESSGAFFAILAEAGIRAIANQPRKEFEECP